MQFSEQIIKDIKRGKQQALEDLYCAERSPFLAWARKYLKCSSQDAKELYQVTILIAYDNIVIGRLEELRCSFKSYLYAIAKNKWKEWQRARIKMKKMDDYFFEHWWTTMKYLAIQKRWYKSLPELFRNLGIRAKNC